MSGHAEPVQSCTRASAHRAMESTPKVLKRRLHSSVMRCTRPPMADYSGFSKMVRFITACPLSLTYLNHSAGRSLPSCVLCNKERSDTRVLGVQKKAVSDNGSHQADLPKLTWVDRTDTEQRTTISQSLTSTAIMSRFSRLRRSGEKPGMSAVGSPVLPPSGVMPPLPVK